jgi:hypothetical protein
MKTLMPQRLVLIAALSICSLLAGGCAGVYTLQPVGEKPANLEPAKWDGTWIADLNGGPKSFTLKVVDGAAGELRVSGIEERNGKPTLENVTVLVHESGEWLFASVRETAADRLGSNREPNDEEFRHAWGRLKRDGDLLIVWAPDVAKFTALVEHGKLRGKEVSGGDILLEKFSAADLRSLTTGGFGVPFEWESPIIFRRLGRGAP